MSKELMAFEDFLNWNQFEFDDEWVDEAYEEYCFDFYQEQDK